jgi:hypothetical protein
MRGCQTGVGAFWLALHRFDRVTTATGPNFLLLHRLAIDLGGEQEITLI